MTTERDADRAARLIDELRAAEATLRDAGATAERRGTARRLVNRLARAALVPPAEPTVAEKLLVLVGALEFAQDSLRGLAPRVLRDIGRMPDARERRAWVCREMAKVATTTLLPGQEDQIDLEAFAKLVELWPGRSHARWTAFAAVAKSIGCGAGRTGLRRMVRSARARLRKDPDLAPFRVLRNRPKAD